MRRWLPKTLRWQFALALVAMATLVVSGGAVAVRALLSLSGEAQELARERLSYMQDAQELLDHARQVQLYAAQGLASPGDGGTGASFESVMKRLDELDRLTARLAVSNDASVLDLHQSSQLFRSAVQVVAQLNELHPFDASAREDAMQLAHRSVVEMQEYAGRMARSAQEQSEAISKAYQASADRLVEASRQTALWVVALLLGSLGAAWLTARYFLGVHVLARLRTVSDALRDMGAEREGRPDVLPVGGEDEIAEMARAVEQGIRDRRQLAHARLQLEESGRRLAAVLENSADAILVLQDGQFLQVNRAAQRLLGAEKLDLSGRPAQDFLKDCDLCGSSVVGTTVDAKVRRTDGTEVDVEIARSEVASVDGRLTILIARDATLRKEAERHLRDARDAAETARASQAAFLAAMSHELRTPLNAILGYAQLLQLSNGLASRQRQQVQIIERSGQHLLALINDVLDIAKHEAGKVELSVDKVHLVELARGVADIVSVKAQERQLEFSCEVRSDVPAVVYADERRLKQVLLNLLSNAVKFTERGLVSLTVSLLCAARGTARLRFEVQDTGVGLTQQQRAALFRPFEQFGDRQHRAEGTGLGLAISQQLIRLMNSEIQVESEPGRGTRFWFDLSVAVGTSGDDHAQAKEPVVGYQGPRRRVLIVDDDMFNRLLLVETLRPLGFIVDQASDGLNALARARSEPPDLIVTDCLMPNMSGAQFVLELKADDGLAAIPVIAISASVDALVNAERGETPFDVCLTKPIEREALLEAAARLLDLTWLRAHAPVRPAQ
nr:ATP-binding protein [uncultured Caldimonas sp.]